VCEFFFFSWRVEDQEVAVEEERLVVGERVCEREGGREKREREESREKREERESE
jgi:hypothetical protein